ncbi:MAG: hypothetical protein ABI605_07870 [Rhizobacter sp.]
MNDLSKKTLEHTMAAIEALDLGLIKFKATRQEDGYGWSPAHADKMEQAYKRYLILHAKYPAMTLAPDQDVDRFWHMHILDTRKYAADCETTFGHFVHHFPYLGLRGEDDAKALQSAFAAMQTLYAQEFGEPMGGGQADASAAWCGVDPGKPAAAWCGVDPAVKATAAWCGVDPTDRSAAAWCGVDPTVRYPAEAEARLAA